jgi:hypothetical protein
MTKRTLFMDIKVGQSLEVDGGRMVITLEHKSGQLAKLKFEHEGANIRRVEPARTGAERARLGLKLA